MTWRVLVISTLAVFLAAAAMVLLVVVTKSGRTARAARRRAVLAPHRHDLIAVSAGEDPDGRAAKRLSDTSGPAGEQVDRAAIDLLGKIRGGPAEQLVTVLWQHGTVREATKLLRHPSSVRRAQAAQVLGLSREPGAVEALVTVLDDPAIEVRTSAAYALGLIGDPAAAARLLEVVDAPERAVPSGITAEALLAMGVDIAEALQAALDSERPGERHVAAYVSGVGSFTRSLPGLRRLLAEDTELTVREASAGALGAIGGPQDVEALARHTAADQPLPLRRVCVSALGDLGDPTAVPVLTRLLDDDDPRLAELAADALVALGPAGRHAVAAYVEPDSGEGALGRAGRGRPVEAALTTARLRRVIT
jgi:HEAT repeat protein